MQFVNPGAPNSPLSVSVSGLAITVSLATDGAGALTSTAAQVVAALNADPAASAILWAATYRGNAGAGIVQPSAVVHLSDFLWAPQVGRRELRTGLPGAAGAVPAVHPADLQGLRRLEDGLLRLRAGARPRVGRPARRARDGEPAAQELRHRPDDDVVRRQPRHLHRPVDQHGRRQLLDAAGRRLRPAPHDDPLLRAEQPGGSARRRRARRRSTRPRAEAGASTTTAASPSARSSTATRARRRAARATRTRARASCPSRRTRTRSRSSRSTRTSASR